MQWLVCRLVIYSQSLLAFLEYMGLHALSIMIWLLLTVAILEFKYFSLVLSYMRLYMQLFLFLIPRITAESLIIICPVLQGSFPLYQWFTVTVIDSLFHIEELFSTLQFIVKFSSILCSEDALCSHDPWWQLFFLYSLFCFLLFCLLEFSTSQARTLHTLHWSVFMLPVRLWISSVWAFGSIYPYLLAAVILRLPFVLVYPVDVICWDSFVLTWASPTGSNVMVLTGSHLLGYINPAF